MYKPHPGFEWRNFREFSFSLIIFLACLAFNPIIVSENSETDYSLINFRSLDFFIAGPIGLITMYGSISWLANPFLIRSWIHGGRGHQERALKNSAIALIFIFYFLFVKEIHLSESGIAEKIIRLDWGYWLWMLSAVASIIAAWRMPPEEKY